MSRAVALALTLTIFSASCATYEGSRDTAALGGATFALGMGAWISGDQLDNESIALTGVAVGTASMLVVMGSAIGMVILPKRVEIALRIAHELVVLAEAGDCETVIARRQDVEDLDQLVYEVVLMDDPSVAKCFAQ